MRQRKKVKQTKTKHKKSQITILMSLNYRYVIKSLHDLNKICKANISFFSFLQFIIFIYICLYNVLFQFQCHRIIVNSQNVITLNGYHLITNYWYIIWYIWTRTLFYLTYKKTFIILIDRKLMLMFTNFRFICHI